MIQIIMIIGLIRMLIPIIMLIIIAIASYRIYQRITKEAFELPVIEPWKRTNELATNFNFYKNKDSSWFADIIQITDRNDRTTDEWREHLAQTCMDTYGCVAFNNGGWLKAGILPPGARTTTDGPEDGLFIRKSGGVEAVPEDLYVEMWAEPNFMEPQKMMIFGKGGQASLDGYTKVRNDWISAIYVPPGLAVTLYEDRNYKGRSLTLGPGAYPDLKVLDFNDKVSSFQVYERPIYGY